MEDPAPLRVSEHWWDEDLEGEIRIFGYRLCWWGWEKHFWELEEFHGGRWIFVGEREGRWVYNVRWHRYISELCLAMHLAA